MGEAAGAAGNAVAGSVVGTAGEASATCIAPLNCSAGGPGGTPTSIPGGQSCGAKPPVLMRAVALGRPHCT
jgi:hypothetical protein